MVKKYIKLVSIFAAMLFIYGCNEDFGSAKTAIERAASLSISDSENPGNTVSTTPTTDSNPPTLSTVHNPEPSSILLLTSGLAGMFIYSRAKLRTSLKKRKNRSG